MDRREFSRRVALGVLGASAAQFPSLAATREHVIGTEIPAVVPRRDRKAWAREHFRGLENFLLPSVTPDFRQLDEDGIRNDVRQAIRQGFVATTVLGTGISGRSARERWKWRLMKDAARFSSARPLAVSTRSPIGWRT